MAANLAFSEDGPLLTWLEPTGEGQEEGQGEVHALYLAQLHGEEWSAPRLIAQGDAFFANWADLPAAAASQDGTLYAHWLSKLGSDTYAYGAALAASSDEGKTWEEQGLLHDDTSPTEHGFVSYTPLPEGGVQAFWLDGRRMPKGGGMQLRTTLIAQEGPQPRTLLDDQVCECCATDATLTSRGPIVAYRDRSSSEIRDISVIRRTEDGWSEPTVIHHDGWKIQGCPVNGPAVAARGDSVVVAWFSGASSRARVATAFSSDGGATFEDPILVDDQEPLGRVDVALDGRGRAWVSWLASGEDGAEIRWQQISQDGTTTPSQVIASSSATRSSGVPRMICNSDDCLFVWLEGSDPSKLRAGLASIR